MKVVQLTTLHPWNDSRIYLKIVLSLVEAGFKVDYIAPAPDEQMPDSGDVNLHWLPNRPGIYGRLIKNLSAFLKATKITIL